MPTLTINGPVVPSDTNNAVLRDALFHSPTAREVSSSAYHVIEIGVREGAYTTYIGTWDQSKQKVDAATPTSILDTGRLGMRLKAGQAVVVRVTAYGTPASLSGSRITFTSSLVGGRDGPAKPLVASGPLIADSASRAAVAALERQINVGGLASWDEPVQLQDPGALAVAGSFQGRIQRDSSTQISLQRYSGNWVDIDGEAVSITSNGLGVTTSDYMVNDGGVISSTAPSASTLYYVYVGTPTGGIAQLRLSTTAPSYYNGVYSLGTNASQAKWRFAGWVRLNASTQFVDDTTDRLVVNYYNKIWKSIIIRPGYTNDDASTTYTTTSTTWTAANAGTGATGSFIANGEDGFHVTVFANVSNSGANYTHIGLGDNSGANCAVGAAHNGTTADGIACSYSVTPASGYRTLVLLVRVSAGTGTYIADFTRNGSATDPVYTALYTLVPV